MDRYNKDNTGIFSLEVDEYAKGTFLEMARWTKFLSIMGFIFLGLIILGGVAVAMMANSIPGGGALAIFGPVGTMIYFLVIVGVTVYPIWALYKFSTGIKPAILNQDKLRFNKALNALKNTFKYYGIMMIIFLGLYGVVLIGVVVYGVMNK